MKKLLMILPIAVVGCKSPSPELGNLNIYQPPTLRLKAGIGIRTVDGVYTPQTNEIWHSDKRYRELERKVYFR
jgi:hypothetical protein